ncbi:MAG: diaminopimelate decarboxylase [Deferribacteraceae bacterium]|jgi:diaminopimelate decarboxylase|nr:diaminopimelate decarboxylase [Deferribacteraceae bacterium]
MNKDSVPFTKEQLEEIIKTYPTPFHIYDERAIEANVARLYKAFSWMPDFKNYFAVKALPNPSILELLHKLGMGTDVSSLTELMLSKMVGIVGEEIMFTSNQTPAAEYKLAKELGAIINLDDITHIDYLEANVGLPELISFRYNPGAAKDGIAVGIGKPVEAKYGLTEAQMIEAFKIVKSKGVKRFGVHTMLASNEMSEDYFVDTSRLLFELALKINREVGIEIEFVDLGGGIGIPYKPDQKAVNIEYIGEEIRKRYESILSANGLKPKIYMECARLITGAYGYLVTRAVHEKHIYREYIGVDACAANLMRPSMYGAYHHITVMGKENAPKDRVYDVVGSLCENSDKFAINRELPEIAIGDLLVIHDTGAHGHSMGYNYNGKLRSAELLLKPDGTVKQIRRAETAADLFATIVYPA